MPRTYGAPTNLKAFMCAMVAVVVALGVLPRGQGIARAAPSGVLRLPGRSISVAAPKVSASPAAGAWAVLDVTLDTGRRPVAVARSDFKLSAEGDMFGVRTWNAGGSRVEIPPSRSRSFRVTFAAPSAVMEHGALFYRPADGRRSGVLPLNGAPASADRAMARSAQAPVINTFWTTQGVGYPWGTAIDSAGKIWFAEPGCDFAPTCAGNTPPGQIGELDPSSGAVTFHTLPSIPGNQPIFLAFDGAGNLWFTTPNNSKIGEFSPSTGTFIGQWAVTPGSGPWDLTFANGQIWYTQHLASAVGRFDPTTHAHQDFPTPSANSNPYGITADGGLIWFTENNSNVDRVARLDTSQGNAISEYRIVQPPNGTPHLIVVGASGQPWWTEGFSNTIAGLNPAAATPASCGVASGTCNGVQRFHVPPSSACGGDAHTSGIGFDSAANRIWLDNSLTAQVGSFTPSTGTFEMNTLSNCSAHPHDGLNLDSAGNVWFDEEFVEALGELIPPGVSTNTSPPGAPGSTPAQTSASLSPANSAAPALWGSAREGRTLTAETGAWTNQPTDFSFTWQRCHPGCSNIAAATGDSYTLRARDIDANVRVIVTAGNAAGSAQAASRGVGPVRPSLRRVGRALARLLAASTRRWTAARLLARGGYKGSFDAPSRGSLWVSWRTRHVLVATAHRRFSKGGARKVAIRLTGAGRRLLKRAGTLTPAARATFFPAGPPAVSRLVRFRVRG